MSEYLEIFYKTENRVHPLWTYCRGTEMYRAFQKAGAPSYSNGKVLTNRVLKEVESALFDAREDYNSQLFYIDRAVEVLKGFEYNSAIGEKLMDYADRKNELKGYIEEIERALTEVVFLEEAIENELSYGGVPFILYGIEPTDLGEE